MIIYPKIFPEKFGLYYKPFYLCTGTESGIARPLFFQREMVYKINLKLNPQKPGKWKKKD